MNNYRPVLFAAALLTACSTPFVQAADDMASSAQGKPASAVEQAAENQAEHYFELRPMLSVPSVVLAPGDAPYRVQAAFVKQLTDRLGPPVGYTLIYTTGAEQREWGIKEPGYGILLRDMLLPSPAELPMAFGARPMAAGSLLVRVGSTRINDAKDAESALAALDAVYPFLALSDVLYARAVKLPPPAITLIAANAGARYGVRGAPVKVARGAQGLKQIGDLRITLSGANKQPLAASEPRAPDEHPLDALLWLRDTLRAQGKSLQPGDLIALGTLTRMLPIISPDTLTLRYEGLDTKPVEISAHLK
jgi:2-keto-4-pentenoate hydratase